MVATFARLPTTPFISPLIGPLISPLVGSVGLPPKPQTPAPTAPLSPVPTNSAPKKGALVNRYMPPRLPLSQRPGFAFRSAQSTAVKPQSASLHKWLWPNAGEAERAGRTDAPLSANAAVISSGYSDLDAELPGGGWPLRQVTELLLPQSACGELRLLLPLLQRTTCAGKTVALISPADSAVQHGAVSTTAPSLTSSSTSPFSAFVNLLPSLNAEGLYIDHLMIMQPGAGNGIFSCDALLAAAEQALQSAQFAVVVLWWPKPIKAEYARRLHAAAAASRGAVFVCRPITAELETSPAALRLALCTVPEERLGKLPCNSLRGDSALSRLKLVEKGESRGSDQEQTNGKGERQLTAKLGVRLIKRRGAVSTCTLQLQVGKAGESATVNQVSQATKPAFGQLKNDSFGCGAFGNSNGYGNEKGNANTTDGRQFMSGSFDDIIAALDIASQAELERGQLNG